MAQLDAFLQEQTGATDDLLSSPCMVPSARSRPLQPNTMVHCSVAGMSVAALATEQQPVTWSQVLLCIGSGARLLGCAVLETSGEVPVSAQASSTQTVQQPAGCASHQRWQLDQASSAFAVSGSPAETASSADVPAVRYPAEPSAHKSPAKRPSLLTKWLSLKASPLEAGRTERSQTSSADVDQLLSAACRAATGAANCTCSPLGVRLLWRRVDQQRHLIEARLLWHSRRLVAGPSSRNAEQVTLLRC